MHRPRLSRRWLVFSLVLFAAWISLRAIGHYRGLAQNLDAHAPPGWISLATTLLLAVSAWVHLYGLSGTKLARRSLLVAIGVTCGFAGDLAFSGHFVGEATCFAVGMALFGAGHIGYLAAMLTFVKQLPVSQQRRVAKAWVFCTVGCLVGWYFFIYSSEIPLGMYKWGILGYVILLSGTAGVGLGLALSRPRLWPLALGGILFVASDFFIVLRLFNPLRDAEVRQITALDWTWLTYSPAQLLLVYTLPWVVIFQTTRKRRAETAVVGEPKVEDLPLRAEDQPAQADRSDQPEQSEQSEQSDQAARF